LIPIAYIAGGCWRAFFTAAIGALALAAASVAAFGVESWQAFIGGALGASDNLATGLLPLYKMVTPFAALRLTRELCPWMVLVMADAEPLTNDRFCTTSPMFNVPSSTRSSALSWVTEDACVNPSLRLIYEPVTTTSSTSSCWANVGLARGRRDTEIAAQSKLRLCGILEYISLSR
jgi:hypothetical protein